jgi:hypothetical protein
MNPRNDRTQLGRPRTAGQPAPRKRFRIEKLEERIAPRTFGQGGKGSKGTNNCTYWCASIS